MPSPNALTASLLGAVPHGFFGRAGGTSAGPYESFNCGPGSNDDPASVDENRARGCAAIGAASLSTAYQVHGAVALEITQPLAAPLPKADALLTRVPGLGLGVLAADCTPILFHAPDIEMVGAAHAGWRGSLGGIVGAAVAGITRAGADPAEIRAVIGPCLRAPAFEVRADLKDAVTDRYHGAQRHFAALEGSEAQWAFDHAAFVKDRLTEAGLRPEHIGDTGGCTLTDPDRWFSYRHSQAKGWPDYGRNLSAIALPSEASPEGPPDRPA